MIVTDVKIQNSLAWTSDLDLIWKENKKTDDSLLWQYFGSETGILRSYPGNWCHIASILRLFQIYLFIYIYIYIYIYI